ncbi:MAG: tail fiber domain-containing protein [Planctomycetes bacterium]|nr:tail fiber domain-containing protein [Planctomycetota bacterium]
MSFSAINNIDASVITAGNLLHEKGGLEADVSAYDGLLKVSGGETQSVAITAAGENLLDDVDVAAQHATLGLGALATQSANLVVIGGGNINGTSIGLSSQSSGNFTNVYATQMYVKSNNVQPELKIEELNGGGSAQFSITNSSREWWLQADSSPDKFYISNMTLGTPAMVIDGSNNYVGISNDAPTVALDVNGDINSSTGNYYSGVLTDFYLALQNDGNLVLYYNGGPIWSAGSSTSDIRLKRDIKEMESVLGAIQSLKVIRFKYTTDLIDQSPQIGLIAQQVEEKYPELVYTGADGRKLLHYDKISAILIKGMQEQQSQIQELKKENEGLKNRLNKIEKALLNIGITLD